MVINSKYMKKESRKMSSRAQITIFIIVAIIIVVIALIMFFWGDISSLWTSVTPQDYVKNCIDKNSEDVLSLIKSGGSIEPGNYLLYGGEKVEYLCYTNEYYKTCSMQQPLLKQHVEQEISNYLSGKIKDCVSGLKTNLEKKGYTVSLGNVATSTELAPEKLNIEVTAPMTITLESSSSFDKFSSSQDTDLYDFIMISSSILNWEARYGDSESTSYMNYYPNIKVQKILRDDGNKVYILTDRDSQDSFKFATRSLAWPAGLGYGQTYTPVK